mmetsp:Transcript_43320/g.92734  ORF Transcript_43320/g.92734 Transcript_43320/m.92734 type:complete len:449 (-) Transcript_43320:712-2058(-)
MAFTKSLLAACLAVIQVVVALDVANSGVGVYVMLSLTTVNNEGQLSDPSGLSGQLDKLKEANIDGFMIDVWWGLTEKSSKKYDFTPYQQLVEMASQKNLKVQMVASFHQCGGNVGDTCNIPLPAWVLSNSDIWFKDQHGNEDKEYISFFADNITLNDGRTPLQMYGDWMSALASTFDKQLGNTVSEIQVGAGPCGELRYPSYVANFGWSYPGVGVFQVHDKYATASLASAGAAQKWTVPPSDAGDYNSKPSETNFFTIGYKTDYGRFFLDWYFENLKVHGGNVMAQASMAFKGKLPLASKVAGIHWWYGDDSHAAEVTAGYYNCNGRNAYQEIAAVLAKYQVALDFTCLEMRNSEQSAEFKSMPENLVRQVLDAAAAEHTLVSGENALPRYDETAYQQILSYRSNLHSFTYLRLTDQLLGGGFDTFKGFVQQMHNGDAAHLKTSIMVV